mmetsp:Transcript_60414/g.128051  ORF Transcript_60414/g.128051 Transcript_60414/m.128051 type:complete len:153 (-) Transcript_60414:977-1435(-)
MEGGQLVAFTVALLLLTVTVVLTIAAAAWLSSGAGVSAGRQQQRDIKREESGSLKAEDLERGFPSQLGCEGEDEQVCAVCLTEVAVDEWSRRLNCHHVFHRECIDAWLLKRRRPRCSQSCPLCRQVLELPGQENKGPEISISVEIDISGEQA